MTEVRYIIFRVIYQSLTELYLEDRENILRLNVRCILDLDMKTYVDNFQILRYTNRKSIHDNMKAYCK